MLDNVGGDVIRGGTVGCCIKILDVGGALVGVLNDGNGGTGGGTLVVAGVCCVVVVVVGLALVVVVVPLATVAGTVVVAVDVDVPLGLIRLL